MEVCTLPTSQIKFFGKPVWIFLVSTSHKIDLLLPVCIAQRLVCQPKPCPVELVSKMNNGMSWTPQFLNSASCQNLPIYILESTSQAVGPWQYVELSKWTKYKEVFHRNLCLSVPFLLIKGTANITLSFLFYIPYV